MTNKDTSKSKRVSFRKESTVYRVLEKIARQIVEKLRQQQNNNQSQSKS